MSTQQSKDGADDDLKPLAPNLALAEIVDICNATVGEDAIRDDFDEALMEIWPLASRGLAALRSHVPGSQRSTLEREGASHTPATAPSAGLMPSCHVCGEVMEGVCRQCGATTGVVPSSAPAVPAATPLKQMEAYAVTDDEPLNAENRQALQSAFKADHPSSPAPAETVRREALEEAINVVAYWADSHRGETTFGQAGRVIIERLRSLQHSTAPEQGEGGRK